MKARDDDPNTFRSNPTGRVTDTDMDTMHPEEGEYLADNAA